MDLLRVRGASSSAYLTRWAVMSNEDTLGNDFRCAERDSLFVPRRFVPPSPRVSPGVQSTTPWDIPNVGYVGNY